MIVIIFIFLSELKKRKRKKEKEKKRKKKKKKKREKKMNFYFFRQDSHNFLAYFFKMNSIVKLIQNDFLNLVAKSAKSIVSDIMNELFETYEFDLDEEDGTREDFIAKFLENSTVMKDVNAYINKVSLTVKPTSKTTAKATTTKTKTSSGDMSLKCCCKTKAGTRCRNEGKYIVEVDGENYHICGQHSIATGCEPGDVVEKRENAEFCDLDNTEPVSNKSSKKSSVSSRTRRTSRASRKSVVDSESESESEPESTKRAKTKTRGRRVKPAVVSDSETDSETDSDSETEQKKKRTRSTKPKPEEKKVEEKKVDKKPAVKEPTPAKTKKRGKFPGSEKALDAVSHDPIVEEAVEKVKTRKRKETSKKTESKKTESKKTESKKPDVETETSSTEKLIDAIEDDIEQDFGTINDENLEKTIKKFDSIENEMNDIIDDDYESFNDSSFNDEL